MSEIIIYVEHLGLRTSHIAPTDMGLSLMEFLKAAEYDVMATCGGMALCATCHVEVMDNLDCLPDATDAELDMLDTLAVLHEGSRLSCQMRLSAQLDGLCFRLVD